MFGSTTSSRSYLATRSDKENLKNKNQFPLMDHMPEPRDEQGHHHRLALLTIISIRSHSFGMNWNFPSMVRILVVNSLVFLF